MGACARRYWLRILEAHIPGVVEKAVASEGSTDDAQRRGHAFALAFQAHLAKSARHPPRSRARTQNLFSRAWPRANEIVHALS